MGSRFDVQCGFRLANLVREEGYDLLHTHTPRAALVGRIASALTGVRMVHHLHSPTSRDSDVALRNKINTLIENLSIRNARALIAVSHGLAEYLRDQHFPKEKIHVVPNGVPTFGSLPVRSRPKGEWVIGCIALFRPRKGIEILIEALARLNEADLPCRVRAVGSFIAPTYEIQTKALVRRLGLQNRIDWIGFVPDVNLELMKMDLIALPSLFGEGMPMVVLEAMSAGVPAVASSVGGVTDVIEHGRSGILVPPDDPRALANALSSVMLGHYDWAELRTQARARQQALYSDAIMASGAASVYDRVLADRTRIAED
jgi:glycosyltransferase involved in cell wall biosynthesis